MILLGMGVSRSFDARDSQGNAVVDLLRESFLERSHLNQDCALFGSRLKLSIFPSFQSAPYLHAFQNMVTNDAGLDGSKRLFL